MSQPTERSSIAIAGGAAALQIAREASKILIRILVIGPAWCAVFLLFSPSLLDDTARSAVEWGEAFRSVPVGQVPAWDCPKATAALNGSPLPPPVSRDACTLASQTAAVWIQETTQGARQVYLFLVMISGMVMVAWRVFRAGLPGVGKTVLGLFRSRKD